MLKLITPNWPAPSNVKAYTTTRKGGHSQSPYSSLNLGDHVGDDPKAVAANRATLRELLPSEPVWLKQIHSIKIVSPNANASNCSADASITTEFNKVCIILTADCLPVLFCDRAGTTIAAVHAGWRGLADGILEATLQHFNKAPEDILVWLGPAIGSQAFEVGEEVRESFTNYLPEATKAFKANRENHWLADLYLLARQRLAHNGVTNVFGGEFCTYNNAEDFYSYRRDKITGRMASLIWLDG